jgi:hypothetical protein
MQIRKLLLAACLGFPALAFAQQVSALAKVTAWGQRLGSRTVYSYQVQNFGAQPIKQVLIGLRAPSDEGDGQAELSVKPVGNRSNFWLVPEGARYPEGWGALLVFPEESATFYINWTEGAYFRKLWPGAAPDPGTPFPIPGNQGVLPGTTLSGFVAVLPSDDFAYVKGHATLVYDGPGYDVTVPITAGDPTPPSLILNVDRVNQNDSKGEWAVFSVHYSASDNHDPEPKVQFEVVASPPGASDDIVMDKSNAKAWNVRLRNVPGTTYSFRATAVDASGNLSTKDQAYAVGATR